MSLLPSRGPDASTSQDGEIEIVGVDEDVSAVIDALSSETAREILNAVYEDPSTPSELADRLDMSIQKVSYHLEKLQGQELIAVAGTRYSEKGQEMKVYQPPDDPLVLFVGTRERKQSLRALAQRLLPAVGILTAASVVVQLLTSGLPFGTASSDGVERADSGAESGDGGGAGGGDGGDVTLQAEATETPEPTLTASPEAETVTESQAQGATEIARDTATEQATATPAPTEAATQITASGGGGEPLLGGLATEPGVAFFLGGLLVLTVVAGVWLYTE